MNSKLNDLEKNDPWWDSVFDWFTEEALPVIEEIISDIQDPEISAWEKYVYDADEDESWLEDQVMDVLHSTERDNLSILGSLTRDANIWFDEQVWDTTAAEGKLETLVKDWISGEEGQAEDEERPITIVVEDWWEEEVEEAEEAVKKIKDTVITPVTKALEAAGEVVSESWGWFLDGIEDWMKIPARAFFGFLNEVL